MTAAQAEARVRVRSTDFICRAAPIQIHLASGAAQVGGRHQKGLKALALSDP